MNQGLAVRWLRRAIVLATTGAVLGIGLMTVQVAADWRRTSAPLDTAPAGMSTISDNYAAETERATELGDQIDEVAGQIADLKVALTAANGAMATDQENAAALEAKLAAATVKLKTLQGQLKSAQARLTELNRAAARQATLNRQARSGSSSTSRRGEEEDDD